MRLIEALERIKSENLISFHMPGHKNGRLMPSDLITYDITEIPGSDHLHEANACLFETEQAISRVYRSDCSKIIINGSTVGILAMILGLTNPGDYVLINRNAHKSVFNAIEMNRLIPIYLMPELDGKIGIPIGFDIENFKQKIHSVKLCLMTYPTYEGLCFPLDEIIALCRENHVPILIDEAHGAHLLLHENGPKSSLQLGADVIVQSFHKTLPALTQTACLHFGQNHQLKKEQVNRIIWYLKSLQTSSPSYVLMASIDYMIDIIEKQGKILASQLEKLTLDFLSRVSNLKSLRIVRVENQEITKLLLTIPSAYYFKSEWDGHQIDRKLREKYGIQVEYSLDHYLLLMTSIATIESDFVGLEHALLSLDAEGIAIREIKKTDWIEYKDVDIYLNRERDCVYHASEVHGYAQETILVDESVDRIAAEYVTPYPPGIPLLVPGERIAYEDIKYIQKEQTHIKVLAKDAL